MSSGGDSSYVVLPDQQSNEISIDVQWQDKVIVFESELVQNICGNDGSQTEGILPKALSKAENRIYPKQDGSFSSIPFISASLQ